MTKKLVIRESENTKAELEQRKEYSLAFNHVIIQFIRLLMNGILTFIATWVKRDLLMKVKGQTSYDELLSTLYLSTPLKINLFFEFYL